MRGIVKQADLGFVGVWISEKCLAGILAEIFRNNDGHCSFAASEQVARGRSVSRFHIECLLLRQACDDFVRNSASVLVRNQYWNPRGIFPVAAAPEDVSEKRSDEDRNGETHDHRTAIHQEQLNV